MNTLRPCLVSFEHVNDVVVEACHDHGVEVWASLRVNDIHDSFMANRYEDTNDPLKAQHPEYLIQPEESRSLTSDLTERYLWSAFNFARPIDRMVLHDLIGAPHEVVDSLSGALAAGLGSLGRPDLLAGLMGIGVRDVGLEPLATEDEGGSVGDGLLEVGRDAIAQVHAVQGLR